MPEQDFATKQDIRRLEERMDRMQDNLIEAMRDMQTEVLRAFHNWASPTDVKMRGHEERLTIMEERLRQIERALIEKNSNPDVH
jgi:hypothetical protein